MVEIGTLGVFAGIAVAMAFFLSYYLITQLRIKNPALFWLGLAVLAVSLRVAKSIIFFIYYEISPMGLAVGFFALASIGPLFLRYIASSQKWEEKVSLRWFLHLIIPASGAITCFLITPHPLETTLYQLATLLLAVYLAVALYRHVRFTYKTKEERQWITVSTIVVWGVWASFVLQHISGTIIYYAYGALLTSMFIVYLFVKVLQNPPVFGTRTRKLVVSGDVLSQVRDSFEKRKIYLKSGMTINTLSSDIDVPAYQITKAVRKLYNKSFPEALNNFRIKAFKGLIADPKQNNFTIEYLAELSGFKTTSSFYTAFKKETGMTPTAYLESNQLKTV